jgi:y4mF family transcriptional regulator
MDQSNNLSHFVKFIRSKYRMTQEELAEKAGVGLRFIRDLEQGKETLRMDKVNQVLALFGYRVAPGSSRRKDQWEIIMNHMNRQVRIYLKDKTELAGILLDYKMEEDKVKTWRFVSNNNALRYRDTKDSSLVQVIKDEDVINVENI